MPKATNISKLYPAPKNCVYFDTASFGLTSINGVQIGSEFLDQQQKLGSKFVDRFRDEELPAIREKVGDFLDADTAEFAFIPNFSFGITAILASIADLKRVLLYKDDYPSLVQPFLLNDFQVIWLKSKDQTGLDLDVIKQSILENEIQIVAISQVQYLTGEAIDIEELGRFCHENGTILIVDGTQSLGAMPFSFRRSSCHIYIASNYKWMNAGHGTGILCVKEEILDRFASKIGGFNSYQLIESTWQYVPSIYSYEPGHLNFIGLLLLRNAVEDKLKLGIQHINAHYKHLINRFITRIQGTEYSLASSATAGVTSSIIGINSDGRLFDYLIRNGMVLRMRNNIIRIGVHFYNSEEDIDQLADLLVKYRQSLGN